MHRHRGFTLIELMVVLAVLAIVASIGIPNFRVLIQNNNISTQTNALLGVLQLARSEAVTQRQRITVCPSSDQSTCNSAPWSAGGIARRTSDGAIVRVIPANTATTIFGASSLAYETDGTSSAGGTLRICDERGDASSRTINVNVAGQASSRRYQAGDTACP